MNRIERPLGDTPAVEIAVGVDHVGRGRTVCWDAAVRVRIVSRGVPVPILDQLEEERVLTFEGVCDPGEVGVRDPGEVVIAVATGVGNQPTLFSKSFCI